MPDPATNDLNHEFFREISPTSAWLAGLLAADGSVSRDLKRIAIAQSGPAGKELIHEIRRLLNHRLALGVRQPARGSPSYSITIASRTMIDDLSARFGITPRKTLHYRWPPLEPRLISAFLRGYVDGDGCVGIYRTPQGNPMLHLSFVGTPPFVRDAMKSIPAAGRCRTIERCKALAEARYSGRHAWAAGCWLYSDPLLYRSAKVQVFERYSDHMAQNPPRWSRQSQQRKKAMALLAAGSTVRAAAHAVGVRVQTVYAWRSPAREP